MDYKRLLSQVERTLEQIENAGSRRLTIEQIADTIAANFRDELGITGGRIYEAAGDNTYQLVGRFGVSVESPLGIVVAKDYKPLELTLDDQARPLAADVEYNLLSRSSAAAGTLRKRIKD